MTDATLNGHLNRLPMPTARKGRKSPQPASKPAAGPDPLMQWAKAGIGLSIVLSAGLNGYANSEHAAVPWAGWALGIAIPGLVLVLARVAGGAYARGWKLLAGFGAAVVVALLGLSVRHCARSFELLTGADGLSSVLLAVGIDCGLVLCELMTIGRKAK